MAAGSNISNYFEGKIISNHCFLKNTQNYRYFFEHILITLWASKLIKNRRNFCVHWTLRETGNGRQLKKLNVENCSEKSNHNLSSSFLKIIFRIFMCEVKRVHVGARLCNTRTHTQEGTKNTFPVLSYIRWRPGDLNENVSHSFIGKAS